MTPHGFVMTHRKMWKKSSYCISDSTRYNFEYSNECAVGVSIYKYFTTIKAEVVAAEPEAKAVRKRAVERKQLRWKRKQKL
jgi:hypothetical protein